MATNDLLFQMATESMNAIGNVIGEKVSEGISLVSPEKDELANFQDSCKKPVGTLDDIPDEVYREVMTAYYDALKEKDSGAVFNELTTSGKSWNEKISDVIDTLTRPVDSRKIEVDGSSYKISFPLSKVGIDSLATITKGSKASVLYWSNEFFGKTALFKYFASLWTIEKQLSDAVLGACFNVLKTNAPDLLQAAYSNTSSSELKELLGTNKTSIKSLVQSKIKAALPQNSYLNSAMKNYGNVTKLYNKLQKEINSSRSTYISIENATNNFIKARDNLINYMAQNGVEISVAALPDVLDPINPYLKYNTAMTAVSVLSGNEEKIEPKIYNSKVKIIDASTCAAANEIVGNSKANKIYGGLGNDTISGGKGKDSLYGGAGDDSLFGEVGNDKLFGDLGEDLLIGGKGTDTLYGGDGNDGLLGNEDSDRLFGEAGNDTIYGNRGDDSLWGGEGADVFCYEKGDGKDIIFDYTAGEDKIFLNDCSISKVMTSGSNITFKIGTGSIKVKDAKDAEITFVFADESESKYINGKIVSE